MEKAFKKRFVILVLPTLIAFTVAFIIPFILGIYLSFTKFTTVADAQWVGLSNYIVAFQDKDFLASLWFTVKFVLVNLVTINLIAFALAYVLSRKLRGTNIFRTVIFMPNLLGGIVLGYIWQLIINGVLAFFKTTLTVKASYGFWGMVIAMNWQMIGYMMVIYIAAIQNISEDVKEAALIDGVNRRQMVTKIILPAITICLFMTTTNAFKMFDLNLALTAGLPGKSTSLVALDIYNSFYNRMGYEGIGQAKAVLFLLIVAAISVTQLVVTRRKEVES
jgi:raffinose/stachyose/melibiose transport system permease protein